MNVKRKTFLKRNSSAFQALEVRRALRIKRLKRHKANLADRHSLYFMLEQEN